MNDNERTEARVKHGLQLTYGRLAMTEDEGDMLAAICRVPGHHIEIGTLWGATAIIAALHKPRPWRIYTMDIMERGFWETGDVGMPNNEKPTAWKVLRNFRDVGVQDRITLMQCASNPLMLPEDTYSTALIDGGHSAEVALQDWINVSKRVEGMVAFHDYDAQHPGVRAAVDAAKATDGWEEFKLVDSLAVFRRASV